MEGSRHHTFLLDLPDEKSRLAAQVSISETLGNWKTMSTRNCDGIMMDITGNCNLRCPYCVTEFEGIKGNLLMTTEIFDKAATLAGLLKPEAEFLVSCSFEPTLHPHFLDLLERIPEAARGHVAFTTNLARTLDDAFFERLALSGIRHVNVSVDSWTPEVFEELRKGARFEKFKNNLYRLVATFAQHGEAPDLRLITVVCRSNVDEIPDLVRTCASQFRPAHHEVRPFWFTPEIAQREWTQDQSISQEEFLHLRAEVQRLNLSVSFGYDLPFNPVVYYPYAAWTAGPLETFVQETAEPAVTLAYSHPFETGRLRITSDGLVRFMLEDGETVFDLSDMGNPLQHFSSMLRLQSLSGLRSQLLRETTILAIEQQWTAQMNQKMTQGQIRFIDQPATDVGSFDVLTSKQALSGSLAGTGYRAMGWARTPAGDQPANRVAIVGEQEGRRFLITVGQPRFERFDVWETFNDSHLIYSGWDLTLSDLQLQGYRSEGMTLSAYALTEDCRQAHRLHGAWMIRGERIEAVAGIAS